MIRTKKQSERDTIRLLRAKIRRLEKKIKQYEESQTRARDSEKAHAQIAMAAGDFSDFE